MRKKDNKTGHINVSVANCYGIAAYKGEIVTQGVLGEKVDILEHSDDFIKIKQLDDYESWISKHQVSTGFEETGSEICARNHFLRIYSENSTSSLPVKDAVIGCRLFAVDENRLWYRVKLPGGEMGWVRKKHFRPFPEFCEKGVESLSREFAGYPYFWGGKTSKGIDCSGFVQLVYALLGKGLPRDSWMQKEQGSHISDNYLDAACSDLLFFGKDKNKVTHVGISLGNGNLIHSSGCVKINSMIKGEPDFNPELVENFISVSRYMV